MSYKLENLHYVTKDDMVSIPKEYQKEVAMVEDDTRLKREKYVIGTLVGVKKTYTIIHGYPGGKGANGVILDSKGCIRSHLGENCEEDNKFTRWYKGLEGRVEQIFCFEEEEVSDRVLVFASTEDGETCWYVFSKQEWERRLENLYQKAKSGIKYADEEFATAFNRILDEEEHEPCFESHCSTFDEIPRELLTKCSRVIVVSFIY